MDSNGVLEKGFGNVEAAGTSSSNSYHSNKAHVTDRYSNEHAVGTVKILEDEEKQLSRSLNQRHIQMIALAGAIGTGLFLSLGSALKTGGPLGALLGYAVIGMVVCAVQFALGEVSALFPQTGAFVRHAEILVDPAFAFAIGWNVIYTAFLGVPSEISASVVLIQFWTDLSPAIWVSIFLVVTLAVAIAFVGIYGEVEFVCAILKIFLIIGIVIMGLCIDLGGVPGQERIGFRYWNNPGPFVPYIAEGNWGKFLGFWSVMNNAVYSFFGVESLSVAAAETENPRQNIPKACKRVFARITIFYLLSVLIVGMIVKSNDHALNTSTGTAAQSPFVIAATRAGIKVVPHIINAVVLTSAWSASNQSLLTGSRTLFSLALSGQAPKIFLKVTRYGIPWVAVLAQVLFAALAYMTCSSAALDVFNWFVSLTSCAVLFNWASVCLNHIRMLQACKAQGIDRRELPWSHGWTYYSSWFALIMCIIFILTGGFSTFTRGGWDPSTFVTAYLDIPLVILFAVGWKLYKKTKWISLTEIPIREALDDIRDNPEEIIPPAKGWQRLNILWG